MNRKKDFTNSLREWWQKEVISSEQIYDTFMFIFSESCYRAQIIVQKAGQEFSSTHVNKKKKKGQYAGTMITQLCFDSCGSGHQLTQNSF